MTTDPPKTSIFDAYRVYFNNQSYKVSIIVLSFCGFLFGWMILLSIVAVLYRKVFERLIDQDSYEARLQLQEVTQQRDLNDEKLMHQINHIEHSSDQVEDISDNSRDKTMEIEEKPQIKGFKQHKYEELQQTMSINKDDIKQDQQSI